jgi:hypothetical protein
MKTNKARLFRTVGCAALAVAGALIPVAAHAASTGPAVTYNVDVVSLGAAVLSVVLWLVGIPN